MITQQPWETDAFHRAHSRLVGRRVENRTEADIARDLQQVLVAGGPEKALVACIAVAVAEARGAA